MKELSKLGLKSYLPEQAEYSELLSCPNCTNAWDTSLLSDYASAKIIGWSETKLDRIYAVFECQTCFKKFKHHITYNDDDQDQFIKSAKTRLKLYKNAKNKTQA